MSRSKEGEIKFLKGKIDDYEKYIINKTGHLLEICEALLRKYRTKLKSLETEEK